MLFSLLFICFFVSVTIIDNTNGQDIFTPLVVKELLKQAWTYLAPFKKTGLERLHGTFFGKGRAARSTDIVIFNLSDYKFKLRESRCDNGGWTNTLLPEYIIPPHTSVVFGAQSYRFLTGLANCFLRYKTKDRKASFEISVSNHFVGRNNATAKGQNVEITTVVGSGNNNIVRFIVNDHFISNKSKG